MIRWCNEFLANLDDRVGLGQVTLLLFVAAALVAAGWYFWPKWLPSRWPRRAKRDRPGRRWRWPKFRWRWRWRRRKKKGTDASETGQELVPHETEGLPELPVEAFLSLADRLAAEGRYAEAIRERLRGIVRELVDAGAIENRPGLTVTELAPLTTCSSVRMSPLLS